MRGVEDDCSGGADPGGHLVLVVPSAVPEPRPSGEQGRVVLGIAVEDEQHLAAEVLTLEVVPGELGGADAVADEDQLCAIEPGVRGSSPATAMTSSGWRSTSDSRPRVNWRLSACPSTPTMSNGWREALGASGPEPERLELGRDVGLGQRVTPRTRSAALEQVGGEEADVGADGVGGDGPLGNRGGPGGGAAASASARAAVSMGRSVLPRGVGRRPPGRTTGLRESPGGRLSGARGRPSSRGRLRTATGELSDVRRRSRPLQRSHAHGPAVVVSSSPTLVLLAGAILLSRPALPPAAERPSGGRGCHPGPRGGRGSPGTPPATPPRSKGRKPPRTVRTPLEIPRPVDPPARTTAGRRRWGRRGSDTPEQPDRGRRGDGPECATPPCGGGPGVVEEDVVAEMPVLLSAAEVMLSAEARRTGVEGTMLVRCVITAPERWRDAGAEGASAGRRGGPRCPACASVPTGAGGGARRLGPAPVHDEVGDALSDPAVRSATFHGCRSVRRGARREGDSSSGSRRPGRSSSPCAPRPLGDERLDRCRSMPAA